MSDNSEKKDAPKSEVLHIKKFDGGRSTPDEFHRQHGFSRASARCTVCGAPSAIRIRVLAQLSELTKRQPELVGAIAASNPNGPYVPTIKTTHGDMVLISDVGACDNCKVSAERTAAKHPSWVIIEIDRMGLASTHKTQVQVPQ